MVATSVCHGYTRIVQDIVLLSRLHYLRRPAKQFPPSAGSARASAGVAFEPQSIAGFHSRV